MTLAAAFALEGVPLVLSDLLITFEGGEEQDGLSLPVIDLQALPAKRPGVHGLRQKLFLVSPQIAIAYASGDVLRTIMGLGALRELASSKELTYEEVTRFLSERGSLRSSSFVGFHVSKLDDGQLLAQRIQVRGTSFDAGYAGEVDAAGSGIGFLAMAISRINAEGFPGLPLGLRQVCKAVSLCGVLTREEHATGSLIAEAATGGAFEVCRYGPEGFVKVEVTFVAWYVHVDGDAVDVRHPLLCVKSAYVDEVLVLNCARWSCRPDGSDKKWTVRTHVVPPAYQDAPDPEVFRRAYLGFDSPLTQHSILVMRGEQSTLTSIVEPGESQFHFLETSGGGVHLDLKLGLYNAIVEASRRAAEDFV